mgnify:FL=1
MNATKGERITPTRTTLIVSPLPQEGISILQGRHTLQQLKRPIRSHTIVTEVNLLGLKFSNQLADHPHGGVIQSVGVQPAPRSERKGSRAHATTAAHHKNSNWQQPQERDVIDHKEDIRSTRHRSKQSSRAPIPTAPMLLSSNRTFGSNTTPGKGVGPSA